MTRNRILGSPYEQQIITSNVQTVAHIDRYLVFTPSGEPVTVTLDPNAFDGDQVTIVDAAGNAGTFPITVQPTVGQIIAGSSVIGSNFGSITFTFHTALALFLEGNGFWTVETSSGTGPNPDALTQTDWYLDAINGNDANPGTITEPVQTISGGIVPKWGTTSPNLKQTVTFHALNAQTLNQEKAILSPIFTNGANFIILGSYNEFSTFEAGAVTHKAPGSPGVQLQVAGFSHGEVAGMVVLNTARGSYSTIDSLSGTTATMNQPYKSAGLTTVEPFPTLVEDNTWAATDTLIVYKKNLLNLTILNPQGGDATPAFTAPVCWVENVYLPDFSGVPGDSCFSPDPNGVGLVFSNCAFDPYVYGIMPHAGGGGAFFINCFLNGSGAFAGNPSVFMNIVGGSINASASEPMYFCGNCIVDGDTILHGTLPGTVINISVLGQRNYFACSLDANAYIAPRYGSTLVIQDVYGYGPGVGFPVLWGAGTLDTEPPNSGILNETEDTFANALQVGALRLDAQTTASSFNPAAAGNPYTAGITITTAHLDTGGAVGSPGLQNPVTGSRYAVFG